MKLRDRKLNDVKVRNRNIAAGGVDPILTNDELYADKNDDLYRNAKANMFIFPKDMANYVSNSEYFGQYNEIKNKPFTGNYKTNVLSLFKKFDDSSYKNKLDKIIEFGNKIIKSDDPERFAYAKKFLESEAVKKLIEDVRSIGFKRRYVNNPINFVSKINLDRDDKEICEELRIDTDTLDSIKEFKNNYYNPIINILNSISKMTNYKTESNDVEDNENEVGDDNED